MADLTTLENVKAYMQIDETTSDTVLARLITAFSQWFLSQINRGSLLQDIYTEQRNGQGGDSITMIHYPVQSVTSLTIDGQVIPASDGMTSGYIFDAFTIWTRGYTFRRGRGNVKIVYEAGYATCPADIEQAVIDQVVFALRREPSLGTVTQSQGGLLTASFSQKDLAPGVAAVVKQYTNHAVVGIR
jgi:hypothetical protein